MAIALADNARHWQSRGHLFVVADGMGAHAAGELASKLATDNIPHSYHKHTELSPSEAIAQAVRDANGVIHDKGQHTVDFQGMGTTCSCLLLLPCGALTAHVGDSRVYRLRGDSFEQLTFDHSLVWEMAAAGHATEEEVPAYVPKNVITRSLGPNPTVEVDVEGPFALRAGDRFLLCSDGLTGPLNAELIGMVLASLPANEVAQTLVDLANLLGGPDNITAVVVEVVDPAQLGNSISSEAATDSRLGALPRARTPQSLTLAVIAICGVLLTAALAVGGKLLAAAISGVMLGVVLLVVWLRPWRSDCGSQHMQAVGFRGKAPYRRYKCAPSANNIETLSDIVRQLEDLEDQRDWQFDWQTIHDDRQQAYQAIARGDYRTAVVAYCSAVRQMMQALRDKEPDPPSDSSVDLI